MSLTYILPLRSDAYIALKICMDFWKETKDDKKFKEEYYAFGELNTKQNIR